MRGLDPEDSDPNPVAPTDSQSSDQSQSKLRQAWDAWTSRPENNAALLQTGLALLQPRSPGQSAVGQFANAIGQGAEASDRNVKAQQEEEKARAEQDVKRREADAREVTAGAYADQVKQGKEGKGGDKAAAKSALQTQMAFQKWLRTPDDATGLTSDPIVGAISKQFPNVKTKADLLADPGARQAAYNLYKTQFAEPGDEDGSGTAAPPAGGAVPPASSNPTAPASAPQPKIVYDKAGKAYQWDGIPGHAPVPMQ